jgi:hypothetical protein
MSRQSMFSKQGTFPYGHDTPSTFDEKPDIPLVSCPICGELVCPENAAGFWNCGLVAAVRMPIATVNEHRGMETRKHKVGAAG